MPFGRGDEGFPFGPRKHAEVDPSPCGGMRISEVGFRGFVSAALLCGLTLDTAQAQ